MRTKFNIGDRVRFNTKVAPRHQVPQHILDQYRKRTRTIIGIIREPDKHRVFYELSGRGKGRIGYLFRSHQLVLVEPEQASAIGRPQKKRKRRPALAQPWKK